MYWDSRFPDIDVEYVADLPNYSRFWNEIEKNSLVVIDDLWTAASNNEHVSNAFKVYSKKQGFSIIIVTQVSLVVKFSMNNFFRIFLNPASFLKTSDKIRKLLFYLTIMAITQLTNQLPKNWVLAINMLKRPTMLLTDDMVTFLLTKVLRSRISDSGCVQTFLVKMIIHIRFSSVKTSFLSSLFLVSFCSYIYI